MPNTIDVARSKAIDALKHCIAPVGLYASGTPEGYTSVWARDSMISLLGGAQVGAEFKDVFKKTLRTLAENQSPLGQIPNAVGLYDSLRKSDVTYNTIDSTLWFVIGTHVYRHAYNEPAIIKEFKKPLEKAMHWLEERDLSEDKLLEQLPTTDWQDAFPHKYGHTINTHALYYAALTLSGERKRANEIKNLVNGSSQFPHLALFDAKRGYYLPWAWKDHDGDREEERWFDSLGNVLAIVTGLAEPKIAESILAYMEKEKINKPYPVKTLYPPIETKSPLWKSYFEKSDARAPYQYLNGGIWPFIGGFYVAALVKAGKYEKAEKELERLAEANKQGKEREWEFNEWLDGKTGKPKGGIWQAWSIGAYLYAYHCVKEKTMPFFGG